MGETVLAAMTDITNEAESADADYIRIKSAIRYIEDRRLEQPGLEEVAEAVGLSPFHFQRLFTRWAGVSPKRFLGFVTHAHARSMLENSASVLDAALDAGLSGPSRLHDLFVSFEAMTPGDVARRGEGLVIRYGMYSSPFGPCLIAATDRGICRLTFFDPGDEESALHELIALWPAARLIKDHDGLSSVPERIFYKAQSTALGIKLHASGTNFQIKVWEALLRIPMGRLVTYGELAEAIGHPGAARAVGNALNKNPIAFVIPCHAVVPALRRAGNPDGYRWGTERRKAMIGWEAAQVEEGASL
ncbi:MAG: methylated-DNA--[protein]-cysteine S-methyltransferase [Rhodospirillales bacterium]|nr:methylated-DNA--[protein]-cysteine S-methyltransferase [Rhodospirillales bacterium]